MEPMIQIAGVIDQKEADMLVEAGATHLGFPLRLPVHKEDLSEAEAAEIIKNMPRHKHAVLVTYLDNAQEIIAFCDNLNVGIVQCHGPISVDELRAIKTMASELVIFKSLVIRLDQPNLDRLKQDVEHLSPFVDVFITDTFDPDTGASGATGKTHDWSTSHELTRLAGKHGRPLILAGGLNPENVYDRIVKVRPAGVDSHPGVEGPDGRKDPEKVRKFVLEARRGFQAIGAYDAK
jgi:phosphoribosylanthranilate isomerase